MHFGTVLPYFLLWEMCYKKRLPIREVLTDIVGYFQVSATVDCWRSCYLYMRLNMETKKIKSGSCVACQKPCFSCCQNDFLEYWTSSAARIGYCDAYRYRASLYLVTTHFCESTRYSQLRMSGTKTIEKRMCYFSWWVTSWSSLWVTSVTSDVEKRGEDVVCVWLAPWINKVTP